jgi:hypothetical protein
MPSLLPVPRPGVDTAVIQGNAAGKDRLVAILALERRQAA